MEKILFYLIILIFISLFYFSKKKNNIEKFYNKYNNFFKESYHKKYSYSNIRPDCIFISIASYRDTECKYTLDDIFEKAKEPHKIFVGICQQNKNEKEQCIKKDFKYNKQIREINISYMDARGPTWARYLCSHLWDGEEYFLQIDSHSRFTPNWDEKVKYLYSLCPPGKNVLSHYPPSHSQYENIIKDPHSNVSYTCSSHFENNFHIISEAKSSPIKQSKPFITPYVSAGFLFAKSQLLHDVPFDPYLPYLFQGEEILLASRFWTHGWNVYNPSEPIITHYYKRENENHPHFWDDHKDWNVIQSKANDRYYYMLDQYSKDKVEPQFLTHVNDYGMGKVRKLQDWFDFAGIDMKNKKVKSRCEYIYNLKANEWEHINSLSKT